MGNTFNSNPDEVMLAVSKGRIFEQAMPLLARIGITPTDDPDKSRKLVLDTTAPGVRLLVIRATDVPTYVEYGAADLGIAGKDVLMEYEGSDYYEPLDLKIAQCRLAVAGPPQATLVDGRTRVATKYSKVAREYYARLGVQAEVIKLYGSMELAPLVGLADRIVDLVDTGNTLKANGLVEFETICEISSRLIVNKAAMKTKHKRVSAIIAALRAVVNDG
ncbi:MAG: ATP phosphoribosyltransferase [Proteobacteria bacterium]|jgi:ATP phosphoribosyltransferase|nr:ATP phosphoribosyltransferase [Pseudomonadota bacterium]MBK8959189.1 ATP phosphoribosyltransferase [Pseudomonadota bacterium]